MTNRQVLGGIVIAILVIGVVYAITWPIVSPVALPPEVREEAERVITEYALSSTDVPGVDYVDLNLTIKAGGINITFIHDSNLIYRLRFKQDKDAEKPSVKYGEITDSMLPVNVFAETGDLDAMFGDRCIYNGTLKVGVGGLSMVLSEHSNVDIFNFIVSYAGGISLEILDEASFNRMNLKATVGGIRMRVDATNLRRSGSVSARVEVGGYFIGPIHVGPEMGVSLTASTDIGGIALNPGEFVVEKETATECSIRTSNYATIPTKLDIDIFVGLGGGMINQPFPGMPAWAFYS